MYTALIIEPRIISSLPIVLNNFNKNLDNNWNFLIFHGTTNKRYIKNIILNMNTTKKCTFVNLNKENLTIKEYNNLLYSPSFYNYIKTEHFLIFQTDTLLSEYYSNSIYKFLEFDYSGGPWKHRNNEIGNGGLSLRRKSKMLELLNNNFSSNVLNINEDLFFSGSSHNISNINIYKPPLNLAKEFSTESIFSENSFGLHKPWNYLNKTQMDKLKILFPDLSNLINTWNYNKKIKLRLKKIKLNPMKQNPIKLNPIILNPKKINPKKINPMKINMKFNYKIKSNKIKSNKIKYV